MKCSELDILLVPSSRQLQMCKETGWEHRIILPLEAMGRDEIRE
jgi:hypothetical protein